MLLSLLGWTLVVGGLLGIGFALGMWLEQCRYERNLAELEEITRNNASVDRLMAERERRAQAERLLRTPTPGQDLTRSFFPLNTDK